jgi:hypothetical protein
MSFNPLDNQRVLSDSECGIAEVPSLTLDEHQWAEELSPMRRSFTPSRTLPHQGGGAIYLP